MGRFGTPGRCSQLPPLPLPLLNSLRLFYTDDHKHGLIYANHMGAPNPRRPLALLSPAYADAPRPGVRPVPVDGGAAREAAVGVGAARRRRERGGQGRARARAALR